MTKLSTLMESMQCHPANRRSKQTFSNLIHRGRSKIFRTWKPVAKSSKIVSILNLSVKATSCSKVAMKKLSSNPNENRNKLPCAKHFKNKLRRSSGSAILKKRRVGKMSWGTIKGSETKWNKWQSLRAWRLKRVQPVFQQRPITRSKYKKRRAMH